MESRRRLGLYLILMAASEMAANLPGYFEQSSPAVKNGAGASLPVMDTATLGRTIVWNTATQAHLMKYLWPEVEFNATYFKGGPNDGRNQAFATPGLLFTHKLRPAETKSRLCTCIAQIVTSHFHSYNHEIAVTTRLFF